MIFTLDNDLAKLKRDTRSNLIKTTVILAVVFALVLVWLNKDIAMDQLNERSLIRYYELTILDPENDFYQQRYRHYNILVNGE